MAAAVITPNGVEGRRGGFFSRAIRTIRIFLTFSVPCLCELRLQCMDALSIFTTKENVSPVIERNYDLMKNGDSPSMGRGCKTSNQGTFDPKVSLVHVWLPHCNSFMLLTGVSANPVKSHEYEKRLVT